MILAFSVERRSNFAAGIMITVAQATSIWNVGIQTAAAQNLLTIGFIDKLLDVRIANWLQWLPRPPLPPHPPPPAGQWLGAFVVKHSGLATQGPLMVFAILAAFLILVHLGFASANALTSALLPIMISVLQTLPGDMNKAGMAMLMGFVVELRLHPAHQCAVYLGTDTFDGRQFAKTGIVLTLAGYLLTLLFAVTYWRWLGWM